MFRFLRDRPWLFIVLAFLLLIGAWAQLYMTARKHPQRELKLPRPGQQATP